jgi:hypothetical protein
MCSASTLPPAIYRARMPLDALAYSNGCSPAPI